MIDFSALLPIVIAIIAALPGLLALRQNSKKSNAEAETLEDQITERVLSRADAEIAALTKRIEKLERELIDVTRGAWANHDALVANGVKPPYVPPRRYASGPLKDIP